MGKYKIVCDFCGVDINKAICLKDNSIIGIKKGDIVDVIEICDFPPYANMTIQYNNMKHIVDKNNFKLKNNFY